MKLDSTDQRHLDAAEGWLGLGDWLEANAELEQITPVKRGHLFILRVRWDVYAKAKKWEMAAEVACGISEMLPDNSWGWIHWAYSLHELKRTKEAQGTQSKKTSRRISEVKRVSEYLEESPVLLARPLPPKVLGVLRSAGFSPKRIKGRGGIPGAQSKAHKSLAGP